MPISGGIQVIHPVSGHGEAQHPREHRVQGDDRDREHEHDPEQPTEMRDVAAVVVVVRKTRMTRIGPA